MRRTHVSIVMLLPCLLVDGTWSMWVQGELDQICAARDSHAVIIGRLRI
jgi:hypothetical protein